MKYLDFYNRRRFTSSLGILCSLFILTYIFGSCRDTLRSKNIRKRPNIILLFADDMGYADLGTFGCTKYATPNLNKMSKNGMQFTDFYVTNPVCAPSRSALLTGSYAARNYVSPNKPDNAIKHLTPMKDIKQEDVSQIDWEFIKKTLKKQPEAKFARHNWGLPKNEITIAQILKDAGYATVMYGKWHLGEYDRHHPTNYGFDQYYGVSQSISVSPYNDHPYMVKNEIYFPNQPFFENDRITDYNVDSSMLTKLYTEHAIEYITQIDNEKSFFMYLSYAMPHIPIGASPAFRDKSGGGVYGDVIAEIDWSVGQILETLKAKGIEQNTLVIFTSDNGPWLAYGNHAGSARPLREGKGTYFEGGVRVPTIMSWPGTIPTGTECNTPAMTIDLMPTFAELAGADLPRYPIDGRSMLPLMLNPATPSAQEAYYFFKISNFPDFNDLIAVRKGDWKLILPYKYPTAEKNEMGKDGVPVTLPADSIPLSLFNLRKDVGEQNNLADQYPEIVKEMIKMGKEFQKDVLSNQRDVEWITE